MIKKVKYVLFAILIVSIVCVLYKLLNKPIIEFLAKKKYEKQIVNNYNNNSFDNVSDGTIEEYNYYKNYYNEPNIDISPLIESYIRQVETNEENPFGGKYSVRLTSNMEREIQSEDYTYIIKLYHGIDRKLPIEELEKILIHNGKDKYTGWCVPKNSSEIIDLPYNFYLKYEPSDFKLLDKVKKVTNCSLEGLLVRKRNRLLIDYLDKNDIKQSEYREAVIYDNNNFKIGLLIYRDFYYTQTHNAKVELKNHDYDEWAKEKAKAEANEPWNIIK